VNEVLLVTALVAAPPLVALLVLAIKAVAAVLLAGDALLLLLLLLPLFNSSLVRLALLSAFVFLAARSSAHEEVIRGSIYEHTLINGESGDGLARNSND
jgi:hypothetical protein